MFPFRARLVAATTSLLFLSSVFSCGADDWSSFRSNSGISTAAGLPLTWDEKTNIRWRIALPGPGSSTPALQGDRIYVTCYRGYGLDAEQPGDPQDLRRLLLCIDANDGSILWTVEHQSARPDNKYVGFVTRHGFASSTPAVDESGVYVYYGVNGALGYDLQGQKKWECDCGQQSMWFGTANSLVLFEDLLIVNACIESDRLLAIDKHSGQIVWKSEVVQRAYNSPHLVRVGNCQVELVVHAEGQLRGFDPRTGESLWSCRAIDDYICPTVIDRDGVVYATGGRTGEAVAVRAGGRGEVTNTHKLWHIRQGGNVPSPVLHEDLLFLANDRRGILYCVDASSGETRYAQRLDPGSGMIYASPIIAEGNLYLPSRQHGFFVVAASPQYQLIAHNVIADDPSAVNASPIVWGRSLIFRSDRYLYCVGDR